MISERTPFYSVIIPVYNHEKYIEQSIRSVLSQTFENLEILVVDDGSTDGTAKIVEGLLQNHVSVKYYYKKNGGVASARNFGISRAIGNWICFLDSDDIWYPQKLQRCFELIQNDKNVKSICNDEEFINGKGEVIGKSIYRYKGTDLYYHLLFDGNCLSPSAFLIKKEIIERIGLFNESKHIDTVEDYDYWIRISKEVEVYFLHEFLGAYRFHPQGISNNYRKNYINTINVMIHNYLKYDFKKRFTTFEFYCKSRKSLLKKMFQLAKMARQKDKLTTIIILKEILFVFITPLKKIMKYDRLGIK